MAEVGPDGELGGDAAGELTGLLMRPETTTPSSVTGEALEEADSIFVGVITAVAMVMGRICFVFMIVFFVFVRFTRFL